MKIVQKLSALIIVTSLSLTLIGCAANIDGNSVDKESIVISGNVDTNHSNSTTGENVNESENKLIDEVEVYKTLSERGGVNASSYEEYAKLYAELETERQRYEDLMLTALENQYDYTEQAISQLILNNVKIHYDMLGVIAPMFRTAKQFSEDTEEEISKKIEITTEINNSYYALRKEHNSCYWAWSGKTYRVTKEMKEEILLFTNLFNLVRGSIGANEAKNDLDKEIERLNIKLEEILSQDLTIN